MSKHHFHHLPKSAPCHKPVYSTEELTWVFGKLQPHERAAFTGKFCPDWLPDDVCNCSGEYWQGQVEAFFEEQLAERVDK